MRHFVLVLSFLVVQVFSVFHIVYIADEGKILMFQRMCEGVNVLKGILDVRPLLLSFDEVCYGNELEPSKIYSLETTHGKLVFSITDSSHIGSVMKRMKLYYEMINPESKIDEFNYLDIGDINERLMDKLERYEGLLEGKDILQLLGYARRISSYTLTLEYRRKIDEILKRYHEDRLNDRDLSNLMNYLLEIFSDIKYGESESKSYRVRNFVEGMKRLCKFERRIDRILKILECRKISSKCGEGKFKIYKVSNIEDVLLLTYAVLTSIEIDPDSLEDLETNLRYLSMILENDLHRMKLAWYDLKIVMVNQLFELKERWSTCTK